MDGVVEKREDVVLSSISGERGTRDLASNKPRSPSQ